MTFTLSPGGEAPISKSGRFGDLKLETMTNAIISLTLVFSPVDPGAFISGFIGVGEPIGMAEQGVY